MSTNMETELRDLQAQTDHAGQRGEQWVKHYDGEFRRLPKGTHVAINCRTGEYVVGTDSLKAIDAYARRFGKKEPGYMIEIGGGALGGWGGGVV